MFLKLDHPPVSFDAYAPYMTPELAHELTALAGKMSHLRVAHLNSTATGGGVAEILQSMVPFYNSLGIPTERIVIDPEVPEFFQATKKIHNLLQGAEGALTDQELKVYLGCIEDVAAAMERAGVSADVWILHDPQLLPLARLLRKDDDSAWIWVCHIDLTAPNGGTLDTLLPLNSHYDHLVFSLQDYVPQGLAGSMPVYIAPPAIDPLSRKNTPVDAKRAWEIVGAMGIDPARPLVSQISRFDFWKDPWGVIDAFRAARESAPGLQLALLGLSQATDDPEALDVLASVAEHAAGRPRHSYVLRPQRPPRHHRHGGQRLSGGLAGADAKVHPRGVWADRHRRHVEGNADDRRQRRRDSRPDRGRGQRLPGVLPRGMRRPVGEAAPKPRPARQDGRRSQGERAPAVPAAPAGLGLPESRSRSRPINRISLRLVLA